MKYPYRFKTEEEFIKEFGETWQEDACWNGSGLMDYLLGTEFKYKYLFTDEYDTIELRNENKESTRYSWSINKDMLTEINPIKPNYLPKRKGNETLAI